MQFSLSVFNRLETFFYGENFKMSLPYIQTLPLNTSFFPQIVQRAGDRYQLLLFYMQVSFGGLNAEMSKQLFDVLNIYSFFKHVGCKAVTKEIQTFGFP